MFFLKCQQGASSWASESDAGALGVLNAARKAWTRKPAPNPQERTEVHRAAPGKPQLAPAARKALPKLPGHTELPHRSALRKAGGDGPAWSREQRAACKLTRPAASTGLTRSWEPGDRHHAIQGCPRGVMQVTFPAQPTHHRDPPNTARKQLPSCDGGSPQKAALG